MPKPHYAVQGGTRITQQSGSAAPPGPADSAGDCPGCKQKSTEIQRLRSELAQAGKGGRAPGKIGSAMVWAALGICGGCLIFALAAILRHG